MSSQLAGLIAAIHEAPDDDIPRLICADWFEEQGDDASVARAEFIRVQVERGRLPVADPRHSELQAREQHGPAWCGAHFVFKKVRFRRGFIEAVHLHLQHFQHHRRQMFALEPVRDVELTGFFRAPAELVQRVAACAEWQNVETLRIHCQGPHKWPNGKVLTLLESPWLSKLQSLHAPLLDFDRDERRRFEQLLVLRRVQELRFPFLNSYPHEPGDWFSDGGEQFANEWENVHSLHLSYYTRLTFLRQLSEFPWWDRLRSLSLRIPGPEPESLGFLSERMPSRLEQFTLEGSSSATDLSGSGAFLDRLRQTPLRSLELPTISVEDLEYLLHGTNGWRLNHLKLTECDLGAEHAHVLANAQGLRELQTLNLSGNYTFDVHAAEALFSSRAFSDLVHLNLNHAILQDEGAQAFAAAPGWDNLRFLNIRVTKMTDRGLRTLLQSANAQRLNWLSFSGGGWPDPVPLNLSVATARALTALPNLVHLDFQADAFEPGSREQIAGCHRIAWQPPSLNGDDQVPWGTHWGPEHTPPLDSAFDEDARGR